MSLVKQLPQSQKIKLTKELEKEVVDSRLSRLLNDFQTDELSLDLINQEVESVREEIYGSTNV